MTTTLTADHLRNLPLSHSIKNGPVPVSNAGRVGPAVLFTLKSRNAKTGPIPVSTTDRSSCPDTCPFQGAGCYADNGPLGGLWSAVTNAGPLGRAKNGRAYIQTTDWAGYCASVAALPDGQTWRANQAGDWPHQGGRIDAPMLRALVEANKGKRGFTYTHHLPHMGENAALIAEANAGGFTVNLSANSPAHADQLAALDIAPVTVVLPADQSANSTTPAGRKIVVCPATQRDDVSCATCKLCARQRDFIIGFPAHGARKRAASAIATD